MKQHGRQGKPAYTNEEAARAILWNRVKYPRGSLMYLWALKILGDDADAILRAYEVSQSRRAITQLGR